MSHMQGKAAEHVIGSTLCAPGCFSLLRASAIKEVLHVFSQVPTDAFEKLQFDHGMFIVVP